MLAVGYGELYAPLKHDAMVAATAVGRLNCLEQALMMVGTMKGGTKGPFVASVEHTAGTETIQSRGSPINVGEGHEVIVVRLGSGVGVIVLLDVVELALEGEDTNELVVDVTVNDVLHDEETVCDDRILDDWRFELDDVVTVDDEDGRIKDEDEDTSAVEEEEEPLVSDELPLVTSAELELLRGTVDAITDETSYDVVDRELIDEGRTPPHLLELATVRRPKSIVARRLEYTEVVISDSYFESN